MVRPETAVVLITADGLAEPVMDDLLAAGELPHIARLIENGVRVHRAIDSLPSLTYPNLATILTGCRPSRHGILGNQWFDRDTLVFRDYTTTRTYRDADNDIRVPTVYELLGDEFTVSIQCAVRRGVSRTIDNWATSGIRWFFGGFEATDQLIPWRFDLIAEEVNRRGCWPVLVHAYFPGVDEIGHRYGGDSPPYRAAVRNLDHQIGLIQEAVARTGMADRTCTILVADHNHTPVPPANWFDVARWLRDTAHLRVRTTPAPGETLTEREKTYRKVDAVVVVGGDRIAAIQLQGPGGWHERPTPRQLEAVLGSGPTSLWAHQAVDWVAVPDESQNGRRVVDLYSRRGRGQLERRRADDGYHYGYTALEGDPLDWGPGQVEELVELFNTPRAGDIALFATPGWDFAAGNRGGHGGLGESDTRVPMIFSGTMVNHTVKLEAARLVDVTPTILGLLAKSPANGAAHFDGTDWSGVLRGTVRADGGHRP